MNEPGDVNRALSERYDRDTESGQVDLLYEQLPSNLLATVLVGLLLTGALWGAIAPVPLVLWFVAVVAVAAGRFLLLRRYRELRALGDGARWKPSFMWGVAINGLLWGVAGTFFYVPGNPPLETLLIFSLAGMSAGAVTTLSPVRGASLLFVVPALVPFTVRLFTYSYETSAIMAAMVTLFVAMMWMISRRLHQTVEKSLRLRFENVELIEDLTRARDVQEEVHSALMAQAEETETAQLALPESHAELERRVQARTRELEELAEELKDTVAKLDAQSRAADEARRAAESANNAKSEFLAAVSHELRTPLNAIVGYQDLLSAEVAGPLAEKQQYYLMRANQGAQQLIGLIDQILNLARIEAGRTEVQLEETDVWELSREVAQFVEPLATKKALSFRIQVPDGGIRIRTDAGKVRQILLNLLANAIKFTEQGEVVLQASEADGAIRFRVCDTGPGIPENEFDRIFEPFTQTEGSATLGTGGSGLGLSVSRGLAELLGGSLTVKSVVSKGSVFTFSIPAAPVDRE